MPFRFNPINPGIPQEQLVNIINANFAKLDSESFVKTFNGPGGNPALIQGKLKNGFYGTAYVDSDGNTVKVEGFDRNGDFIELTVKDGEDAYTVLGY
jgi:hypothetical protein